MLNVLWLTSWYPNDIDPTDGDFIQRHARAVSRFCKVQVIHVEKDRRKLPVKDNRFEENTEGDLSEQLIYYSSRKTGIKMFDRYISHKKYTKLYRAAISAWIEKNGPPDLVNVHVAVKAGLAAQWIKRKWGIPFVLTEHWTGYDPQTEPNIYNQHPWIRSMHKKVLNAASLLVPVSHDLGKTIQKNMVPVKYKVIPNVVDTELFFYKPAQPAKFRFLHVSYMNHQKNPEGILKACAALRDRGHDFEILMLGNDDAALQEMSAKYGLLNSHVFFQGFQPYSEVAKELQRSSAFLLFSRYENLPCVVLEALCCGLPVISTKVGGIAEVIDDTNGILVENENVEELVNAMEQLINLSANFNRQLIAENAAAQFNYETVGKQYLAVYDSMVDRSAQK